VFRCPENGQALGRFTTSRYVLLCRDGSYGSSSGLETSLFGIFIRRMIVAMMDANHISERLASLKNEMSDLRVANALYCNRKGNATLEKSASALRHRRLVEIRHELADLMKRCA
jgi:hypothetical protein